MKTDNELIAEFMGAKVYTDWGLYLDNTYYKFKHGKPTNDSPLTFEEIEHNRVIEQMAIWNPKYDTSWDWLMPVVEKIEALGYDIDICGNNCIVSEGTPQGDGGKHFRAMIDVDKASKMESVYDAVVEFINWYNSQNQ